LSIYLKVSQRYSISLLPNGDCGDSAITLTPSILILGNARLRYKKIPFVLTKLHYDFSEILGSILSKIALCSKPSST
jgi:hypothetical protein